MGLMLRVSCDLTLALYLQGPTKSCTQRPKGALRAILEGPDSTNARLGCRLVRGPRWIGELRRIETAAFHIVLVKHDFGDRERRPIVPTGIRRIEVDRYNNARADIGAAPPTRAGEKFQADREVAMVHGEGGLETERATLTLFAKIARLGSSAPVVLAILGHAPGIAQLLGVGHQIGLRIRGEDRVNAPPLPAVILSLLLLLGRGERDAKDRGVLAGASHGQRQTWEGDGRVARRSLPGARGLNRARRRARTVSVRPRPIGNTAKPTRSTGTGEAI